MLGVVVAIPVSYVCCIRYSNIDTWF